MVGVASKEKPQFDVAGQLEASKRENAKLKTEVADFKKIGSPAEAKALQQQIAQARDSQGPVEDLEKQFSEAKEKETAYDELVKKVNALDSEIANTRSEIGVVRSHIDDARQKVMALRKQSELEYARFQNELARAEIGQRTLLELQKEDNQRFQEELKNLQEYLSRLNAEQAPAAPAESAVAPAPDTGAVGS
jgi:chromosome segregation ATPase